MKTNKQRLFEVMSKLNPDFKPMNEIGTKTAATAMHHRFNYGDRGNEVFNNAITSLFSKFIGRDLPFVIKTANNGAGHKYQLLEVKYNINDDTLIFHFYNENGEYSNATYADNKKEVSLVYSIKEDKFKIKDHTNDVYAYNAYMVNFLINAANTIRKVYFTQRPITKKVSDYPQKYETDVEATEAAKISRLTKRYFSMVTYDRKNIDNVEDLNYM